MNNSTSGSTDTNPGVFNERFVHFNKPAISVLLGRCYSSAQLSEAVAALAFIDKNGIGGLEGCSWEVVRAMRAAVRTTRLIEALNKGRKWARRRVAGLLAPMLAPGIAVAVVPSHDPWLTDTPICLLARELAGREADESGVAARVDATPCLVRHTKVKRIVFGGQSNVALHRRTIQVGQTELIAGQRILLLDDIAKSGQSLIVCRDLLYDAGAKVVQEAALGRVIGGDIIAYRK